jgi:hypothetical protein
VDDSADEAPAAIGLSLPLPFFFFDFLDLDECSSEATDSASNCKTVRKPTTIGDAPALLFNDGVNVTAFSSAGGDVFSESLFAFEEAAWELVAGD